MSFGGWGGGRVVKVGFCVEGCTDWHTQTKWLTNMDETMSELIDIEKDFIQWMVMGPDCRLVDSFDNGIDLDPDYPGKGDDFEISLSYRYGNCGFLKSLTAWRSSLKYWRDVTRANKLIITSSSSKGWDINVLTVYLDRGNAYV